MDRRWSNRPKKRLSGRDLAEPGFLVDLGLRSADRIKLAARRALLTDTEPHPEAPEIELSVADLARLTREVELHVTVDPHTGTNRSNDYWTAALEDFEIYEVGGGIDGVLDELADRARTMAFEILLDEEADDRERLLPVAVRIWTDYRLGRLREALEVAMKASDIP